MFGRRAGLFSTLAAVMLLLGGCGNAGANLGGTMDGYNNGYGNGRYANGGAAYWDGYGINSGRSMDNGANYTTYGTRNDNTGTTLGQDLEDTWDDLTGQDRKTKGKTVTEKIYRRCPNVSNIRKGKRNRSQWRVSQNSRM